MIIKISKNNKTIASLRNMNDVKNILDMIMKIEELVSYLENTDFDILSNNETKILVIDSLKKMRGKIYTEMNSEEIISFTKSVLKKCSSKLINFIKVLDNEIELCKIYNWEEETIRENISEGSVLYSPYNIIIAEGLLDGTGNFDFAEINLDKRTLDISNLEDIKDLSRKLKYKELEFPYSDPDGIKFSEIYNLYETIRNLYIIALYY